MSAVSPMEVIIRGRTPLTPKERIEAVELAVEAICKEAGEDPADATMVLLVAAAHMTHIHSGKPVKDWAETLANALGHAIIVADDFFDLRTLRPSTGKEKAE